MNNKLILHITTLHPRSDTRIRVKQVATLAEKFDASVKLIVNDGFGDEFDAKGNFEVHDIGGANGGRLKRIVLSSIRMYRYVQKLKPNVVHFHDPELIIICLLLKLNGCKVIYDVHEDLPRQILSKHYLPKAIRKPISILAEVLEKIAGLSFDGFSVATETIAQRFPASKTIIIKNYPVIEEFKGEKATVVAYKDRSKQVIYVGNITGTRGGDTMVNTMEYVNKADVRFCLLGGFQPLTYKEDLETLNGWGKVDFHGWLDRQGVVENLNLSRLGLVVLKPTKAYVDSLPVKMFEYMAAGLPVIASDFPLWREIIEESKCGLLVDPESPKSIASAVDELLEDPTVAEQMGIRGREAVLSKYNWNVEAKKLVDFYKTRLIS